MPYVGGAGLDTQRVCLEETRHEILDEITTWINNIEDNTSRVFWLHGNAGTGKSSIAHTIADRFKKLGRLGSCYCFDRNKMAEERHKKIFTTIARDLADRDKQMRRELANVVHLDNSLKNTTDILQQWKELIMKPAKTLSEAMVGPIVIVIDALDESGESDTRRNLLRILSGKLGDDESHIARLPSHLRILLTSRPLPDIFNALKDVDHVQQKPMDSIEPSFTKRDIQLYISRELSNLNEMASWNASVVDTLVGASGGLFEWARLACAFIEGDNEVGLTLRKRFEAVIDKDDRIPLLDGMYKLTLETMFPKGLPKRRARLDLFRSVLAQIIGTAEPLPLGSLRTMRCHFADKDDVDAIIKPMGALLSGTTDPLATICPLHASFPDFLTDESRSNEFFIETSCIHDNLAFASLGVMEDELQFNICKLPSSYLSNSKVVDLAERVEEYISPTLSYSCRFWAVHLQQTAFNSGLAGAVREFFNHERLLFWIEVLSLLKRVNRCASWLSLVIQWVVVCFKSFIKFYIDADKDKSYAEYKDISDAAAETQRFIRVFGGAISFSTPHLYVSAVPFSPKNSHIQQKFARKFGKVLQIFCGHNTTWLVIQGVLQGHSHTISVVAFSPDGKQIVSGSYDNTIRLWDAETGEQLQQPLEGHWNSVTSVAFSPDGKQIVSGSSDKTIRLWDAETGEQLQQPFKGHQYSVTSVAFSPNGKQIVSGSYDNTIRIWDAETGEQLQQSFKGHEHFVSSVAFSPDGKQVVSGSGDKTIRLWDAETGEQLQQPFKGHENSVSSAAFSPDGKQIVSGSGDETIRLWNAETGEQLQQPLKGHENSVSSVSFSPDGKQIVSGSYDNTIRLWNAETGEQLQRPLKGHENSVSSAAFSPDGKQIVSGSGDETIRLWNAETGEQLQQPLKGHENSVCSVSFSPDGKQIVSGSYDKTIKLWDAETGEQLQQPLKEHEDGVSSVAFSPNGKQIVSGSYDNTIRLWDAETGKQLQQPFKRHQNFVTSVAFSPDGKQIVSGSQDNTIRLWDAETGEQLQQSFKGHEHFVSSVAFSPNGKQIVSGSYDNTIRLWDAETGKQLQQPFKRYQNFVTSVAFSPDGKQIVSGSEDNTIGLWDAETGEQLQQPLKGHGYSVYSVAFSPDGKQIVSGSDDNTIRLWDAETGEQLQQPFKGHWNSVTSVAFSPDGKQIVSGSYDKTIRLWNVETGEQLQQALEKYENSVSSIVFPSDGMQIVPTQEDKTLQFFLHNQLSICFSLQLEHALTNFIELLNQTSISSECQLTDLVKVTDQGWTSIASGLLFWAPPTYKPCWYHPTIQRVIPVPVQIDLSQMVHGNLWNLCYHKSK